MPSRSVFIKAQELAISFWIPLVVLLGLILAFITSTILHLQNLSVIILLLITALGIFDLIKDTIKSIIHKSLALDYIAIIVIIISVFTGQFFVAGIIALMSATGQNLEKYGMARAKQSLSALVDRIPNMVHLWEDEQIGKKVMLDSVKEGQIIAVRKGEVIPLDGILETAEAIIDESSLTGEPYIVDKVKGDLLRSGTVNSGNIIVIKVTQEDKNSTYTKIINMVREAQTEKAPFIRLADQYSVIFTIITFIIAGVAFALSGDFSRILSILVIATPCPLIIATPIALIGGMNAAAQKKIIMKKISSIEVLSRVNAIIFDKTGTLTLGKPSIKQITISNSSYTLDKVLGISAAIERSSLHPLAKAIVHEANKKNITAAETKQIEEKIGVGISGIVYGNKYTLAKLINTSGMSIELTKSGKRIALFEFEDKIKEDTKNTIKQLKLMGQSLLIFTGDKKEAALHVAKQLGNDVTVKAECTPEDKKDGINELKKQGKVTAMVGDGINDAPALAMADVGMVFSNEEHTAASEAADIVFLVGDFKTVTDVIAISKRSIRIALQSITVGIGLSIIGMIIAAFGFVPPIIGAFTQEAIDVIVILNALRASRG